MAGLIFGAGLKFDGAILNFSPAPRIRPAIGCRSCSVGLHTTLFSKPFRPPMKQENIQIKHIRKWWSRCLSLSAGIVWSVKTASCRTARIPRPYGATWTATRYSCCRRLGRASKSSWTVCWTFSISDTSHALSDMEMKRWPCMCMQRQYLLMFFFLLGPRKTREPTHSHRFVCTRTCHFGSWRVFPRLCTICSQFLCTSTMSGVAWVRHFVHRRNRHWFTPIDWLIDWKVLWLFSLVIQLLHSHRSHASV